MNRPLLASALFLSLLTGCADDSDAPTADTGTDAGADTTTTGDATDTPDTGADASDTTPGVDLGGLLDTGGTDAATDTATTDDTSTEDVDPTEGPMNGLYGPGVERIVVEFDYEVGAEPETTGALGLGTPFDTFAANADALFGQHSRPIEFADRLADMGQIPDQSQTSYTSDEILALSNQFRDQANSDSVRTFHVIWLNGLFADDSGDREQVLGVSIGDTQVVAMFKPTISRYGGSLESQVEQATLVHEFGHAVGLTNRGVPMESEHHDAAHGAHCSNEDCIMYWTVDGPDVVSFLDAGSFGDTPVLFGPECLADVDAAAAQ